MEILFEFTKDGRARKTIKEKGEVVEIEDYTFFDKGTLLLKFDKSLKITNQTFSKENIFNVLSRTVEICKEKKFPLKILEVKSIEEFKIPYKCPFCNKETLKLKIYREIEEGKLKQIPIIPIVYCENCKRESIYLSNEFLKNLVVENRELFTKEEIEFFEKEEENFLKELRASVAAVFGKKKIGIVKFE
ncbi:MAG: hypothetical protein ACP5HJ_02445 [Candidatus Micrarchaeia archaeon]